MLPQPYDSTATLVGGPTALRLRRAAFTLCPRLTAIDAAAARSLPEVERN